MAIVAGMEMIELAKECDIVVLSTDMRMYEACGLLYSNGLNKAGETDG